jgi:predicted esterase
VALSRTTQWLIAGGIAGLAYAATRPSKPKREPIDCPPLNPDGDTLAGVEYLERRSADAPADAKLPMVIVFHSMGASPQGFVGFYKNLQSPARVITPRGLTTVGSGWGWTKFASKTKKQDEFAAQLRWSAEQLAEFIRRITRCRPTSGRPIVTGSSQGGHMSYAMASLYPTKVRAAVALAGYLPTPLWNSKMAPTWGMHGRNDDGVPYARTVAYWDAMKERGAKLQTESYDAGHGISSAMSKDWRGRVNDLLGAVA